jgi:hypothetical protein
VIKWENVWEGFTGSNGLEDAMAVRVEVKLRALKGKGEEEETTTTALLSTGYEREVSELIVPLNIAQAPRSLPELPPDARVEEIIIKDAKLGNGGSGAR